MNSVAGGHGLRGGVGLAIVLVAEGDPAIRDLVQCFLPSLAGLRRSLARSNTLLKDEIGPLGHVVQVELEEIHKTYGDGAGPPSRATQARPDTVEDFTVDEDNGDRVARRADEAAEGQEGAAWPTRRG